MGNQGHSTGSAAQINDWVAAGAIGQVREVLAFSRKNYWTDKPIIQGSKIPETLDWNLYLNRAGEIPFSESYMNREWIGHYALLHPGATLKWDAAKMEITNHEAANKSLFMRRLDPRDQLDWF